MPSFPILRTAVLLTLSAAHPLRAVTLPSQLLHDGDPVDLRGTLRIERQGWSEILVLHTATLYRLAPGAPDITTPSAPTQDFALTLPGQDDLLARSAGRPIRVSGRLQLTPASPYTWNGTLVFATTVALPSGDYLNPRLPDPGLALSVRRYIATATLQPRLWPRLYTARDADTHRPLPTPNLAGCHVNGAGDVLNCFCTDGFHPTSGLLHNAADSQPATITTFAQFPLPEPASTPITAEVDCVRTAAKE